MVMGLGLIPVELICILGNHMGLGEAECNLILLWLIGQSGQQCKLHKITLSNVSRFVLEMEVEKLVGLGLDNIVETHQDSYMCRQYDTNLVRVSELEHQLRQLKSELHSSIKAFHPKPSSASTEAV